MRIVDEMFWYSLLSITVLAEHIIDSANTFNFFCQGLKMQRGVFKFLISEYLYFNIGLFIYIPPFPSITIDYFVLHLLECDVKIILYYINCRISCHKDNYHTHNKLIFKIFNIIVISILGMTGILVKLILCSPQAFLE